MTTHTDLIARLREDEANCHENAGEAADALEALEQQVAAQQAQMYEDRRQALVWMDQVAVLTKELDGAKTLAIYYCEQLAAAQADNARLRKQLIRVVGDHNPPRDCYATGPMTGNDIEDLVSCPSCEAEVLLALPIDDSALMERLKEERERCKKECEGFTHRDDKEVAEAIAVAIGSMT